MEGEGREEDNASKREMIDEGFNKCQWTCGFAAPREPKYYTSTHTCGNTHETLIISIDHICPLQGECDTHALDTQTLTDAPHGTSSKAIGLNKRRKRLHVDFF